jgi:diguanylate cyclase (GGDEF)-like protein
MQKIAILYDASQAVLSTFDLDEVLEQILSILRDYFRVNNAAIFLLDEERSEFFVRKHTGRDTYRVDDRIRMGAGLIGTAAKLKRPVYVPDVSRDVRYIPAIESTQSELAIPLMVRDEVVGVLDIQSDQLDAFDPETLDLLTLFSTQASIALENARLYTLEQRRRTQLEAINVIARQTTAIVDLDELLQKVCELVLERFPVDHVAVLLAEDEHLSLRAHQGSLTPMLPTGSRVPSGGLAQMSLERQKPMVENEVVVVPDYVAGFVETRAEVCIPLIYMGEKLGVVCFESIRPHAFQNEDVSALEAVADIVAAAVKNAYYFERARQLAYLDGLTGIYNRRYFEKQVAAELERASRYGGYLSLVMVDVDHFKRLNDEFGHLLGDEVLRTVASIFGQQLRKSDMVCRYGGEEFAIIAPQTSGKSATEVAEKLRRMVEAFTFPGVPVNVTISLGVAEYPTHGRSRDEMVAAADSALYEAKGTGRNRVRTATVSTSGAASSSAR